jgi:hypothetical protein
MAQREPLSNEPFVSGHPYYAEGGVGDQPELPPEPWTHYYWPAAFFGAVIAVALAILFGLFSPHIALWAGVIVLAVPETAMAVMQKWNNTFSVWVWNTLRITQGQPIREWTAEHFLMLGAYLVLVSTVCSWIAQNDPIYWTVLACWMSLWLAFHFFWRVFT